jgi:ATPase subunit of ABC transporter with duplicated ATPase domains
VAAPVRSVGVEAGHPRSARSDALQREEGHKPTEALSGGETARLLFCRIMLLKPNVLILDEPTNHLDLESINALNVGR